MGGESHPAAKKCSFPTPEKFSSPNSNSHVITQCKLHLQLLLPHLQSLLLYDFFNFRLYLQIYHANFDQPMVTESYCSMTKALNSQNSSKQNFQPHSPPFSAIWKTLLQLLLVFLFIPFLFHFKLYKFLLIPLQL